ncbi:hypothetical protein ACVWZZ_003477 [Bradyrhizobium sp. LM6.10]
MNIASAANREHSFRCALTGALQAGPVSNEEEGALKIRAVLSAVAVATAWALHAPPAAANEKVGAVVRRLADACVGAIIQNGALEKVVRSGVTATVVCSCAAEIEVARGSFPKDGFDAWAVQSQFKQTLARCAGAQ